MTDDDSFKKKKLAIIEIGIKIKMWTVLRVYVLDVLLSRGT